MAIKKSELYSSLRASCDELLGGMDAGQHKDYVLVMLFVKYVSDRHAGQPLAPIEIPDRASFKDMVALIASKDIGDLINKHIIGPLAEANKLSEIRRISQRLTQRIKELGELYKQTLSELSQEVAFWEQKVISHLEKMGYRI